MTVKEILTELADNNPVALAALDGVDEFYGPYEPLVTEWLLTHGYDALWNTGDEDSYGCQVSDIAPCGVMCAECCA